MKLLILVAVLGLVAAACSSKKGPSTSTGKTFTKGGTFRTEIDEFPWEQGYGFDPTVEYVGDDWTVLKSLLVRGLTSYSFLTTPQGGDKVIPDMAEGLGQFSADGKTVTYKIKKGISFGDPINREITAADFVNTFNRLGTSELTAGGYDNYYVPIIEGMQDFKDGKAKTISGITTPDPNTIVFKLLTPQPDWDFRMAMPAASPMPEEATKCFKGYAEYGNYVVSSGPYEFEGMDAVDFSNCGKVKPPSGFKLEDHMFLVRNPKYDPATDTTKGRDAYPDRFEFRKNTNVNDIFDKVERGEIEYGWASVPPKTIAKYTKTPSLTPYLHATPDNATWYLTMNLTTPPFDDINVRKAVNQVMDKTGIIKAVGGPSTGDPAEHAVPPTVLGALQIGEYDPYASAGHDGDLAKAKEFMKLSKYDTNKDGICDAAACKNITHITRNTSPFPAIGAVVDDSLQKIGITTKTQEVASFYGAAGTPAKPVEFTSGAGWGPDWPDPLTFFQLTYLGESISIANNINLPMTGFTAAIADNLNKQYKTASDQALKGLHVPAPKAPIPGIETQYNKCGALTPGDARRQCWVELDKTIMEQIVPWVPYRWSKDVDVVSPAVENYQFDTFGGNIAFSHVAIDQSKQVNAT